MRLGRALRKDNTGYDLKQLFVGTAGAGGIVTRATLEVHPLPKQSATALIVPTSDDAVMALLAAIEAELGDFLSAFEGLSGDAMRAAIAHVPNLRNPFKPEPAPDFAVLVELESASSPALCGLDLQDTLNRFLEDKFETLVANAVIGNGSDLWQLRHALSEGTRSLGKTIAFDVSVPRSRIMAFRRAASAILACEFPQVLLADFGHIADGGLHFNVVWPKDAHAPYAPEVVKSLRDRIYDLVVREYDGSFSAEHGVGPHNIDYYRRYTDPITQAIAGRLRALSDPLKLCGAVDFGALPTSST
jgi:FAD/FMN-containing dehydrogenase